MSDEEKIAAYPPEKIIKCPPGYAYGLPGTYDAGRAHGAKAGAPAFLHHDPLAEKFGVQDDQKRSKWGGDGKTSNIKEYMRYYMKKWRQKRRETP